MHLFPYGPFAMMYQWNFQSRVILHGSAHFCWLTYPVYVQRFGFVHPIMDFQSPVVCQLHFATSFVSFPLHCRWAISFLRFLFRILLFCDLYSILCFVFFLESKPASGGDARAGASSSAGLSRDSRPDPVSEVGEFIYKYDYPDPHRLVAMWMNGDSASVWYIGLCDSRDTAVGVYKKRCWHLGGRGASICRFVSRCVDITFVRCFKEVEYGMVPGQSFVAILELPLSKFSSPTELIKFQRLLEPCNLLES